MEAFMGKFGNLLCIVGRQLTSLDIGNLGRSNRRKVERRLRRQGVPIDLPRMQSTDPPHEDLRSRLLTVPANTDTKQMSVSVEVAPSSSIHASVPLDPTDSIAERLYCRLCSTIPAEQAEIFLRDLREFGIPWGCLCQLREDLGESFYTHLTEHFSEAFTEDYCGFRFTELGAQVWRQVRQRLLSEFQMLDPPQQVA
jgi:hypothetical protein